MAIDSMTMESGGAPSFWHMRIRRLFLDDSVCAIRGFNYKSDEDAGRNY